MKLNTILRCSSSLLLIQPSLFNSRNALALERINDPFKFRYLWRLREGCANEGCSVVRSTFRSKWWRRARCSNRPSLPLRCPRRRWLRLRLPRWYLASRCSLRLRLPPTYDLYLRCYFPCRPPPRSRRSRRPCSRRTPIARTCRSPSIRTPDGNRVTVC